MKLFDRFIRWRLRRRHAAHKRWLRRNHVMASIPPTDFRAWSDAYMNSVKKNTR